jgi:hypothetical protein
MLPATIAIPIALIMAALRLKIDPVRSSAYDGFEKLL